MARERKEEIIVAATEEIQSVRHVYPRNGHGGEITVIVGTGSEVDGEFYFDADQTFRTINLVDEDYDNFILTKNKFNRNDLWTPLDNAKTKLKNIS